MTTITEFIAARLDDRERIALAATDERANGEPEHWRWECTDDDEPIDVDLAIAGNAEVLEHGDHFRVGLRSVAEYPSRSTPGMSFGHLVLADEEVSPQDARHIAMHDPAWALRDVAAKRAILALADKAREWVEVSAGATAGYASLIITDTLRQMAAIDRDHPDYLPEWAPETADAQR